MRLLKSHPLLPFRLKIQEWLHYGGSDEYIPLLAEEGIKYNIGWGGKCGCLLVGDPTCSGHYTNMNVLQLHVTNLRKVGTNQFISFDDAEYLNIMTDLRGNNLLMKTDIRDQDILFWSCSSTNKKFFEYLADWSQDGLKTYKYKGFPIFHSLIKHRLTPAAVFPTFLGVSVLCHPQDMSPLSKGPQWQDSLWVLLCIWKIWKRRNFQYAWRPDSNWCTSILYLASRCKTCASIYWWFCHQVSVIHAYKGLFWSHGLPNQNSGSSSEWNENLWKQQFILSSL